MGNVAALGVNENVRVDNGRVRDIVTELGEVAAGGVLQVALEQMAMAVQGLRDDAGQGDMRAVIRNGERLSRLAMQVGLVSLADVARCVANCACAGDIVALGATLSRMERVANISLIEIWEYIEEA